MTASASVVEAVHTWLREDASLAVKMNVTAASVDRLVARLSALNTPHPAEQDAREAVDLSSLIAARCVALPGKLIDCPVCLAVDNERDRQAAPDGWRLVPVEPTGPMKTEISDAIRRLTIGDADGNVAVDNGIARLIWIAAIHLPPAPPAQGAGG